MNTVNWLDHTAIKVGDKVDIEPLGSVVISKVLPSYNRTVVLVQRSDGDSIVLKAFRFKGVPISMLTTEVLRSIAASIDNYKKQLHLAGVSTSSGLGFIIRGGNSNEQMPLMIQYEDYGGESCAVGIKNASKFSQAEKIINAMLNWAIKPLFDNATHPSEEDHLITGIDINPRNFVSPVISNSSAILVDLFPTKVWDPEYGFSLEFPEPQHPTVVMLGIFRHYDCAGLIINLFSNLARLRPELGRQIYLLLEEFLRHNGYNSVEEGINKYLTQDLKGVTIGDDLLSVGCFSSSDIRRIIEDWTFADFFRFRCLACALALCRSKSRFLLDEIFSRGHFQHLSLTDDQMCHIKALIFKMADDYPVDYQE
ncbi:MAG: hypothetical protein COT81_02615 [Candidatus Buchananbacteria bacterium CG10_big_fil_rev_8_21_14_0_10_42_9]|uniref:Aminoglycoside phosphotransferase domain-containing protein n=1 Tax=Candidatus Buchananbacteria bacterium CG10_big_fil_rev_8_21_14_0_10_42_9 TaxID=1974526 RepID=A0A2H0W3N4_9BACT|nr:MAG: hypothetical protein COT81_02615 [Candidatus Buchananbacteria bacterium CG10_big_fil_rev_8_21_14_0_10_42_9]